MRHASQVQRKGDVAFHVHVRKQGVVLKHHAYVAFVRGKPNYFFVAELQAPVIGLNKTRQHHQQRRFS